MPRLPSQITVSGEPVKENIYAPDPHSGIEPPIYIASVIPDMNRASGPGNIQNLRYNTVEDRYVIVERNNRDNDCCSVDDTLCLICFCCCLCD